MPGGKPVAIALATLGLASTAITIVLSVIPGSEETNKPLAVAKVLGATLVLVGAGVAVFVVEKREGEKKWRRQVSAVGWEDVDRLPPPSSE